MGTPGQSLFPPLRDEYMNWEAKLAGSKRRWGYLQIWFPFCVCVGIRQAVFCPPSFSSSLSSSPSSFSSMCFTSVCFVLNGSLFLYFLCWCLIYLPIVRFCVCLFWSCSSLFSSLSVCPSIYIYQVIYNLFSFFLRSLMLFNNLFVFTFPHSLSSFSLFNIFSVLFFILHIIDPILLPVCSFYNFQSFLIFLSVTRVL